MAAIVVHPEAWRSGRDLAASLGLVPRQEGTGGKVKLGPISKRGNRYLRTLLVNGAMAVLASRRARQDAPGSAACSRPRRARWRPARANR